MGRPKKTDTGRVKRVNARFTPDEFRVLQARLKAHGGTMTQFVRDRLLAEAR